MSVLSKSIRMGMILSLGIQVAQGAKLFNSIKDEMIQDMGSILGLDDGFPRMMPEWYQERNQEEQTVPDVSPLSESSEPIILLDENLKEGIDQAIRRLSGLENNRVQNMGMLAIVPRFLRDTVIPDDSVYCGYRHYYTLRNGSMVMVGESVPIVYELSRK